MNERAIQLPCLTQESVWGTTRFIFKTVHHHFMPYARAGRLRLFFVYSLVVMDILAAATLPYLFQQIMADLKSQSLPLLLALMGLLWFLNKSCTHLQEIFFFPLVNRAVWELTKRTIDHVHKLPLDGYRKLPLGELMNSLRRISSSARSLMRIIYLQLVPTLIKLGIALSALAMLVGPIIGIYIALIILCLSLALRRYARTRERAWAITDRVNQRCGDSLLSSELVRFFPEMEREHLDQLLAQEAHLWQRGNLQQQSILLILGILGAFSMTISLIYLVQQIELGKVSIEKLVLLKSQWFAALVPLSSLVSSLRQAVEATIDFQRIATLLEMAPEKRFMRNVQRGPIALTAHSLTFHHEGRVILNDLSFEIRAGEKVALIGASGSGKSTLARILAGLISPQGGELRLYGHPIAQYSFSQVGRSLCYISQDGHLFNDTLRMNLTYGLSEVNEEELESAIQRAQLRILLHTLPQGYETRVGELGTRLSGGERQRVALARAFLLRPDILILDETLHALDEETERKVIEELFEAIPTLFIISHHATILALVDRTLQLTQGGLVEKESLKPLVRWKEMNARVG